jgi:hypothetical protein
MKRFTKFIIKFGTTGGTARWVARHYLRLKTAETSDIDVIREIVEFRYKILNPNQARDKLKERLSYLDNLTDLTFSILQLEGAIKTEEMTMNLQMEVTTIIMEELKKKGVPEKAIIGKKTI